MSALFERITSLFRKSKPEPKFVIFGRTINLSTGAGVLPLEQIIPPMLLYMTLFAILFLLMAPTIASLWVSKRGGKYIGKRDALIVTACLAGLSFHFGNLIYRWQNEIMGFVLPMVMRFKEEL